ncbi:hypothetical protein WT25_11220 [Burkholderia territorii]|uniref:hypothetical protein n=1 Tax=Burkholderia territorii TaxID=1503055 RepID=UPI00075A15F9|nr:hypothetical protein [Burkholderia territorii]KVT86316.1 hypothetical protein WT25_11220 [Burkholderia territorii]
MAEIDKNKMRALVAIFRRRSSPQVQSNPWLREDYEKAADAILALCDRLEAAEKDAADARTALNQVKELVNDLPQWKDERHIDWSRGKILGVVKIALAQRQEES